MPLSAGTRLGPYEILAPIGAGGMGEVYKARDTRLDRVVAIKVSKTEFSERFEREAKAIAALNHSNICTLYDVGPNYLVMEYVEGTPLKGPLPLDQALKYAVQICDALDAAHKKGITHRDLKPANILVTKAGIKLLDFGLAKLASTQTGQAPKPDDSTLTMALTGKNEIVGTLYYMSPEQLQAQATGQEIDGRSDIFSFGLVLYEMLTGKRTFEGSSPASVIAAIMERPAPSVADIAPPALDRVLRKCLEKDPDNRWQSARDLKDELEWIGNAPGAGGAAPTIATPWHRSWLPWCVAAFLLLVLMPANILHFREAPPEPHVVNATLLPPDGAEFDFNPPFALPALSPDGTRIVFGAKAKDGKTQLWLRRLDSDTAQPLPGTEGANFPFWSPDSRWVGFGEGSKLKKIDIQGGPPVAITDLAAPLRGGSWSPAGVIVFGVNAPGTLMRVAAAGGTAAPATTQEQGKESAPHVFPWFLPDGRHFLYTSKQAGDIPVRVGSLDEPGKVTKVVAQAHSNAVYAQGNLLYLRERTLMAQPFDPDRLETKGEAVPLAEGVPTFPQPSRPAGFTVSAGGLLVYQSGAVGRQSRLAWKDRQGKELGNLGEESSGQITGIALSPNDKHLAAQIRGRSGNDDLWIYDTARGIPTRFTFDPATHQNPVWSPDGSALYFSSNRGAKYIVLRKASNGAGAEELLLSDSVGNTPNSVSPDGKLLLYHRRGENGTVNLWVLPLTPAQSSGKPEPHVFLQTPFNLGLGQFSPDGQWVAYQSYESGQFEVYVAPFSGRGGKRQISYGGGTRPRWRRDGRELFYVSSAGELMVAEIAARNGTLEVGRVQKLLDGVVIDRGGATYDVSADGQKFLVVDDGTSVQRPLTLLQNWPASLRK